MYFLDILWQFQTNTLKIEIYLNLNNNYNTNMSPGKQVLGFYPGCELCGNRNARYQLRIDNFGEHYAFGLCTRCARGLPDEHEMASEADTSVWFKNTWKKTSPKTGLGIQN